MVEEREIKNLSSLYNGMDRDGKAKMFLAAKNLLSGQAMLKTQNIVPEMKMKKVELKTENYVL